MTEIIREKLYPEDSIIDTEHGKISVSHNVKTEKAEEKVKELIKNKSEQPFRLIQSLCPECAEEEDWNNMKIPAVLFVHDGKIKMRKNCPEHGECEEVYWGDADYYFKAAQYADWKGITLENPKIKIEGEGNCPMNCGLCSNHKSHTNLGNIAVTNRCPLNCFYCFFFAKEGEPIYEPSIEQMRTMLRNMRQEKPVGCNALQITGGEPLIREDIVYIVKMVKEEGYEHIQMNTEGIHLAEEPQLAKDIINAGVNIFYLSFDGTEPQINPKNYWEIPRALENIRGQKAGVVFVPTVIGGHNDHNLGEIINFAAANIDLVRGVNFQPVSLVGRMPKTQREKQRVTIPETIAKIEEQTNGQIKKKDFYPIPFVTKVTDLISQFTGTEKYRLSPHFACGAATYLVLDQENNELVPITRFIDVEGLFKYIEKITKKIEDAKIKKLAKTTSGIKMLLNIKKFIDEDKQPKGLDLVTSLKEALTAQNYDSLKEFHNKSLFIGMMHFQDPYNYDIDRVERCVIHYAMPNGTIVPFCAFNVLPELYRDKVQREFSKQPEEWEKETGKKLADDNYIRNISEEEKEKVRKYYEEKLSKAPGR